MIKNPDTWRRRYAAGHLNAQDIPDILNTLDTLYLAYAQLARWGWVVHEGTAGQDCPQVRYLRQALNETPVRCYCDPPETSGAWCTGHCINSKKTHKVQGWE